jgi:hypothetical protein
MFKSSSAISVLTTIDTHPRNASLIESCQALSPKSSRLMLQTSQLRAWRGFCGRCRISTANAHRNEVHKNAAVYLRPIFTIPQSHDSVGVEE